MCSDHGVTSQHISQPPVNNSYQPTNSAINSFSHEMQTKCGCKFFLFFFLKKEREPANRGGSQRCVQTVAGDGGSSPTAVAERRLSPSVPDPLMRHWLRLLGPVLAPAGPPPLCPSSPPSACCHRPSGGLTRSVRTTPHPLPSGLHPGRKTGSRQELKMCSDAHHQLPEVITNFTITISARRSQQSRRCRVPRQPAGKTDLKVAQRMRGFPLLKASYLSCLIVFFFNHD